MRLKYCNYLIVISFLISITSFALLDGTSYSSTQFNYPGDVRQRTFTENVSPMESSPAAINETTEQYQHYQEKNDHDHDFEQFIENKETKIQNDSIWDDHSDATSSPIDSSSHTKNMNSNINNEDVRNTVPIITGDNEQYASKHDYITDRVADSSTTASTTLLYYQLEDGQIYGPFPESQVLEWFYGGYFSEYLLVSTDPYLYPFITLREWMHYYRSNAPPAPTNTFSNDLEDMKTSVSNWISQKMSKSIESIHSLQHRSSLLDPTQLSNFFGKSSQSMRKAMNWQSMKQQASKLVPKPLKTVLPAFVSRSKYQDATLDAMWSKKNRQAKVPLPNAMVYDVNDKELGDDKQSSEPSSSNGADNLFSFIAPDTSSTTESTNEGTFDSVSSGVDAFLAQTDDLSTEALRNTPYNTPYNAPSIPQTNVYEKYVEPSSRRSIFYSILSIPRKLVSLLSFSSIFHRNQQNSDFDPTADTLSLWEINDRKQQAVSGPSPSSITARSDLLQSFSPEIVQRKPSKKMLVIGVLVLSIQLVSWWHLLRSVVTDVDMTIWMSRYEDLLHRVLVIDFLDLSVYRYLAQRLQAQAQNLVQMFLLWVSSPQILLDLLIKVSRISLESAQNWLFYNENIAISGVFLSTLLLSSMSRFNIIPSVVSSMQQSLWMGLFGMCIVLLQTKVLASLEITTGAAAYVLSADSLANRALSPGMVLVLRISSVVKKLQLLWWTWLFYALFQRSPRETKQLGKRS